MIPRHVAAAFSPPIQTRGDAYFRKGAVHIGRLTSAHITAIVHGTVGYLVTIDASPRLLDCSCSCPYAAEHGLCKHIWAVLLAVDAERKLDGVLATAGPRAAIRATYDEEIDVASKGAWPPEPRKDAPLGTASAPPPAWRSVLNTLERQMSSPIEPASMRSTTWHDDRRLVYIADLPQSAQSAGLVVEVASEREVRPGEWDAPVQFRGDPDAWQLAPD